MAGRPEKRLEPDDGPVQRLAYELRLLREQAGSPTYRTMAQRVRFSVTTLAQAASGERMPSLQVLRAYVQACGADLDEWQVRWKQAVEESAATLDTGGMPPPYRGPAPYEPEDRAFFFGRDSLVAELVALVTERRFAILSGASGSGKSSLLRAGLVPALQETAGRLRPSALVRLLTPGEGPAAAYDRLLNRAPTSLKSGWWSTSSRRSSRSVGTGPSETASSTCCWPPESRTAGYGWCSPYGLTIAVAAPSTLVSRRHCGIPVCGSAR